MNLYEMVCELAACNELSAKPEKEWPDIRPFDIDDLREQAERIPTELITDFLDGEHENVKKIACEHEAIELHCFLNFIFNDEIKILNYNQISDCGCRFESDVSNNILLCEECSKLPCHNK